MFHQYVRATVSVSEYVFPPEPGAWFPFAMLLSIDIALLIMI